MISQDFEKAKQEYEELYPSLPFFDTWVPREKFVSAEFDGQGNISISREDHGIYGIAVGPAPVVPGDWKNFSIESRGISSLPKDFKAVVEWDCLWAPTKVGDHVAAQQSTDSDIAAFLKVHAPDSSVFPGNDEILQWVEIYEGEELAAVAALCRWESGKVVISSVATHSDLRERGLGKRLMNKCLVAGHDLGEKYLSLGVRHENESAQRLYRATGFALMHNFTYCERR
jgi:ribosomal protein S18 acetylase RimI-like enzyme